MSPLVQRDACFQSGLYHSTGMKQIVWFVAGTAVLVFLGRPDRRKAAISSVTGQADLCWRSLYNDWRPHSDTLERI